jgi:peptidoglycan hydrolase-like protein with peptidoglycan-binding domain
VENTQKAVNKVQGSKLKEDGDFGPKTERAVKAFQRRAGLTADGIVGPKTSASLRRRLSHIQRTSSRQGRARRNRSTFGFDS